VPLCALEARTALWQEKLESVSRWIAFAERAREARRLGMGSLVDGLLGGSLQADQLAATFERSYCEALRTAIFAGAPELRSFDGELHDRRVARFQELDKARIELAREDIAHAHWQNLPRGNLGIGPLGVLNGEIAKRRKLLPIRQLIEKAGPAIQQLKPIFMMSPLSVAQFLKPGAIQFDLLVMDEASQIEPVDALGAVARASQIVVVGDERQLPPTRFFAKLTGDDPDQDEESEEYRLQASNVESVLDLCLAKGMPDRMLNWHYRSKHQSLIAVSNREFYENRLFIVPSPFDAAAGMGLKFNHLPNAFYDRGNTRTNPVEAKTVAEAVIRHARETPEQTLGVATFSTAQRQAILKELELLRREHSELEPWFGAGGPEPFFVKNLENVQGDERDVIFISVGYGKTKEGYLAMNFGPVNGEGGERRLNVLISRAKLRCEVFSSITGDDIDLERARSRGVAALKMFLTFAQTGRLGIAQDSGREADSVFEEEVAARLGGLGYDVRNQIGVAGFFVDIAVADPEKPGRFVLGIECDGAQYHSSRSARDRDRLRQAVLEAHGWIIHRIWSTDWYLRPNEELEKVRTAVEEAIATWRDRDEGAEVPVAASAVPLQFSAERIDEDSEIVTAHLAAPPAAAAAEPSPVLLYAEAEFAVDVSLPPHEVHAGTMARHVARIVEAEGPVHLDEICTRVRLLWGLGRAGNRIRTAVARAAQVAERNGEILAEGEFYTIGGREAKPRDRSRVASPSLRRPEVLPPSEIKAAVLAIVRDNFGAERRQLATALARAFGFAATSAQLRAVVEREVEALIVDGQLREQAGLLLTAQAAGGAAAA
jgi:very-short-patch-repair endonuclease